MVYVARDDETWFHLVGSEVIPKSEAMLGLSVVMLIEFVKNTATNKYPLNVRQHDLAASASIAHAFDGSIHRISTLGQSLMFRYQGSSMKSTMIKDLPVAYKNIHAWSDGVIVRIGCFHGPEELSTMNINLY